MSFDNNWVSSVLNDFIAVLPGAQRYFCIGSVALLSYTAKTGYRRKIKDVDIICDTNNFHHIVDGLKRRGYKQYTFIDKSFLFYTQLLPLASSKYYRFEKNGKNLEVMTTDFVDS